MIKLTQQDRLSSILKESQSSNEINLNSLAEKLSVSTRTVRNDITDLNKDLKNIAEFKIEKGNYWLHLYDEGAYKRFLAKRSQTNRNVDTLQKRDSALVTKLLDAHEPLKTDDLAEYFNIGRTTLMKDLKRLRITLESYNLTIKGKPNAGIQLEGNEWQKRIYILQNTIYKADVLSEEAQLLVQSFAMNQHIEEQTQNEWLRYMSIMLWRIQVNHLLSGEDIPDRFQSVERTKEFQKVNTFAEQLQSISQTAIPSFERLFITLPILGRRSPVNVLDLSATPLSDSIKKLICDIEWQVKDELNISFDFEKVARELGYHLMFMINRLVFGVRLHNSLIAEVKKKYPLAYEMAEIAYDVIYKNYHIRTTEPELGYLAYYFGIMITEQEDQLKSLKRVAIVCDTGRSTARIIEVQLSKILDERVEKKLFSSNGVSVRELENFDVIFSTVSLPDYVTAPIIHVTDIFDERQLLKKINQLYELKKLKIRTDEKHFSIIGHLVNEDKFFVLPPHRSYKENLTLMMDRLYCKSYIDKDFKRRVFEREKKSQMIFDNEIAFPHVINKKTTDIMFAIGVCPQGVKAGEKTIRIIFLLGVPEKSNNEDLLINVYDEMIALSKRSDWIDRMTRSTTYSELKRFFEMEFY